MRIGVFDSGVGGLTVLQSLIKKYPSNEYIYIGDNANCPYGNKTKAQLFKYSIKIIDYFINNKVDIIAIACNTVCSNIFDKLKQKYKDTIIIGVIDPTINEFIKKEKKNVLVIATEQTIKSKIYETKIHNINKNINVYSLATPKLVPLIEKNLRTKEVVYEYLKLYQNIDSIILGCTHYKLIEKDIQKNITIINSSDGILKVIKKYLINNNKKSIKIYTTGDPKEFNILCYKIININAKKINL